MTARPIYKRIGPVLVLLSMLAGCNGARKDLNKRVTLWRRDKIPYGTMVAYEGLTHLFPDAVISINRESPSGLHSPGTGKAAFIAIVAQVEPDASDLNALMNFVGRGNHVFLSSFHFGDSLLHTLGLRPGLRYGNFNGKDTLRLSVYNPVTADSFSFAYPGKAFDNYFSRLDTQYTTVLGRDEKGRPNMVRFNYKGGGTLSLQLAPMAFTNFFLLHKGNMRYYDNALSYLPSGVQEVIWDDYFRYEHDRSGSFSAFRYILNSVNSQNQHSLAWAFWLLLLLFLVLFLFDSKRRQRIVPAIEPLRNTSLDFVKTIGRLYFQRKDNRNLALKMVTHFQDQVRTRFNLPVTVLDENFVERLSYKTGMSKTFLRELTDYIKELPGRPQVSDEELMDFDRKMKAFHSKAYTA